MPLVDIEVPIRTYRSQPSVGCTQLTSDSIVLTFSRLPSVDIEVPVRQYRSQLSAGCPLTLKLLESIVLNLLS